MLRPISRICIHVSENAALEGDLEKVRAQLEGEQARLAALQRQAMLLAQELGMGRRQCRLHETQLNQAAENLADYR